MKPKTAKAITWDNFHKNVIEAGNSGSERIEGPGLLEYFFDNAQKMLGIRIGVQSDAEEAIVGTPIPKLIKCQVKKNGTTFLLEITCVEAELFIHFFHFMSTLATQIQEMNRDPIQAFLECTRRFRSLVEVEVDGDANKALGLWGELWFLQELLKMRGGAAIDSWTASLDFGEPHDFRLFSVEIEVKTTGRPDRVHIISQINQLQENPGFELYILSILCGPAGDGSGLSINKLISQIKTLLSWKNAKKFEILLERSFFNELSTEQKDMARILRSEPFLIEVNSLLPHIDRTLLQSVFGEAQSRFEKVQYSLNLEGLGFSIQDSQSERVIRNGQ